MNKIAVYPGSFDPITNGHLEIIKRASMIFDMVIVLVAVNPDKKATFTPEERVEMISKVCEDIRNVDVRSYSGLVADFMKEGLYDVIIRGLRTVTDFEVEFQMAHINKNLYPYAETMFLCADDETTCVSSSVVKQIARFGGDISDYVPNCILDLIETRIKNNKED